MSRRRESWSMHALPGIRRAYASELSQRADHFVTADPEGLREVMGNVSTADLESIAAFLRTDSRRSAEAMQSAALFWATIDMARIALDASTDVPSVNLAEVLPAPSGILAFSAPLPPVPWDGDSRAVISERVRETLSRPLPTDALSWGQMPNGAIFVTPLSRKKRDKEDRMTLVGPLVEGNNILLSGEDGDLDGKPVARAVSAFLQAAFTLMAMPTVAEVRDVTAATGAWRPAATDVPIAGDVRVIDLRPLRHVRLENDQAEPSDREFRHRWIVRGHWRQQAVGPKHGQRRTTWIPSYIKGPDGAPLLEREDVMVWRR